MLCVCYGCLLRYSKRHCGNCMATTDDQYNLQQHCRLETNTAARINPLMVSSLCLCRWAAYCGSFCSAVVTVQFDLSTCLLVIRQIRTSQSKVCQTSYVKGQWQRGHQMALTAVAGRQVSGFPYLSASGQGRPVVRRSACFKVRYSDEK